MRTLALFDFDGTLYKKDSLIEFTRFAKGNVPFYKKMLLLFPDLIGLKLRLLPNEKVKVKFLTTFFKGMAIETFESAAKDFALNEIEKNLNPKIFDAFLKHLESGHEVYIVSASASQWIAPWSEQYKAGVIGTQLQIESGRLTGKLASKNCYGIEKVNRIKAILRLEEYQSICVYGSGKGDREMLGLAKTP
ncbi:MAG TPA: HAD-IB family hydrolase [Flavobacterium sp.]|nr:HAD-IB family hydrolase [Flavobacterium sp.]